MIWAWIAALLEVFFLSVLILFLDWLTGHQSQPWSLALSIAVLALARTHQRRSGERA